MTGCPTSACATSECPAIGVLAGALARPKDAPGVTAHLDLCPRCRDRAAALLEKAHIARQAGEPGYDCDDALLMLAFAGDEDAGQDLRDATGAAPLFLHLMSCPGCREAAIDSDAAGPWTGRAAKDVAQGTAMDLPVVARATYGWGPEVGRGGMGRVVEVWDRRLGRRVVIKEALTAEACTWDERRRVHERLEEEARLTARLDHPGIVAVHEAGRWPTGEPFYEMRRIAGVPLDLAIAEAATPAERLGLLPRVLAATEAVAYAHSQKIIHCDLKPHNIVVGAFGETVVIDWGLARDLDASAPRRDARVCGTPAYMAPEQAQGRAADERADVYALGAVLYHVLAGAAPYTDPRSGSRGISRVFGRVVTRVFGRARSEPPTPLRVLAPDTPRALRSIVARAMARDPAERFAHAGELAAELGQFQRGRLVRTHHYSLWELVQHTLRKHRGAAWASAVLLLALVVTAGWSVHAIALHARQARAQAARATAEQARASLARDQAEKAKDLAEQRATMAHAARDQAEKATARALAARQTAESLAGRLARALEDARAARQRAEAEARRTKEVAEKLSRALEDARAAWARAEDQARRAELAEAEQRALLDRERARVRWFRKNLGPTERELQ